MRRARACQSALGGSAIEAAGFARPGRAVRPAPLPAPLSARPPRANTSLSPGRTVRLGLSMPGSRAGAASPAPGPARQNWLRQGAGLEKSRTPQPDIEPASVASLTRRPWPPAARLAGAGDAGARAGVGLSAARAAKGEADPTPVADAARSAWCGAAARRRVRRAFALAAGRIPARAERLSACSAVQPSVARASSVSTGRRPDAARRAAGRPAAPASPRERRRGRPRDRPRRAQGRGRRRGMGQGR